MKLVERTEGHDAVKFSFSLNEKRLFIMCVTVLEVFDFSFDCVTYERGLKLRRVRYRRIKIIIHDSISGIEWVRLKICWTCQS